MSRLLPYPPLAAALLLIWLLLTQSFSPGQLLLGALVSLIATHAFAALRPPSTRERRAIKVRPVVKLALTVAADILRSNLAVAAIVLFARRDRVSGFIEFPVELRDRNGLALLALIITATPGTLWVDLDRRRARLLIHVLDLVDEEEWIALIKRRYERLLIEIFEQ